MRVFPYFVTSSTSVYQAREIMAQHRIGHLPVMEGKEWIGVITDHEMEQAEGAKLALPPKDRLSTGDVFVRETCVVDRDEPLDQVLLVLAQRHLACAGGRGRPAGWNFHDDRCLPGIRRISQPRHELAGRFTFYRWNSGAHGVIC